MKQVTVKIQTTLCLPDSAELMIIDLEDFHETEVLRLNGQLYMPTIEWMQFVSKDVLASEPPHPIYGKDSARSSAFRGVSVLPQELMGGDMGEYEMIETKLDDDNHS